MAGENQINHDKLMKRISLDGLNPAEILREMTGRDMDLLDVGAWESGRPTFYFFLDQKSKDLYRVVQSASQWQVVLLGVDLVNQKGWDGNNLSELRELVRNLTKTWAAEGKSPVTTVWTNNPDESVAGCVGTVQAIFPGTNLDFVCMCQENHTGIQRKTFNTDLGVLRVHTRMTPRGLMFCVEFTWQTPSWCLFLLQGNNATTATSLGISEKQPF